MVLMDGSWGHHGDVHGFTIASRFERGEKWEVLERVGRGKPLPWEDGFGDLLIVFPTSKRPAPHLRCGLADYQSPIPEFRMSDVRSSKIAATKSQNLQIQGHEF